MSVQFAPRYTALIVASLFATAPMAVHAQSTSATTQAATTKKAATTAELSDVVLSDIQVNGLQRSDPTSVFSAIPVKVGQRFNSDKGQEIIKVLFATGLYEDVSLDLNGNVLVITLAERPVISDLSITGMKQFERTQVLSTLKTNGFAQGYAYDPALLERVKAELQAMYAEAGLVNVKIDTDVKPEGNKQVSVAITIEEGKFTKVKRININGNEKISDRSIRSAMETDKNGIFSWYTKDSRFTPEKLNADLESIRGLYYDRGYMDFDFTRVETPPSADGKGIDINIDVTEGVQYRVSSISFAGNLKEIPSKDIEKIVKYPKNALYSRTKISEIVNKVTRRFSQEGYALAKVEVKPVPNASASTVDVTIAIDPQERVYVRRINVVGNSRTKDEVIRREVRQMETAIYNDSNVQLSRDRIDRLGFFSEVAVDVAPVDGVSNQVDVTYRVIEIPTGTLKLGLGYSSTDKLGITGSISENNILGTGNSLGVDIDTSESNRNLAISTSNPYFTKDGVSQNASLYYRTYDASNIDLSDVKYTTYGFDLVHGIPVSEKHRIYFGLNPEKNKTELDRKTSPSSYVAYIDKYNTNSFTTVGLTSGWSYDTRDSTFAPTRGVYQRLNFELAPVGTLKYYKASYQYQQFIPLAKHLTFAFNTQFDYGAGFGGSKGDYPFFKNMYLGGLGSVRGYESGSLGPVDEKGNHVGGSKRILLNTEFQFPFPGMSKNRGVRLFTFADAAGLWSDSFKTDACDFSKISLSGCGGLRYSYGVGLSWNSPIGPLKFSYALPINKKDGDKIERFQFQIGTSF